MTQQVRGESTPWKSQRGAWSSIGLGLGCLVGCGGFEEPPPPQAPDVHASPLMVRADPPGHEFSGATIVRLRPMAGSVDIFYTVDGAPATAGHATPYTGALELESTTLLNYIARDANGAWSAPGSELYVSKPPATEVKNARRGLRHDPEMVFFAWKPGDPVPMREVITLTAFGEEPVTIASIRLVRNPGGQFFWEAGAFELELPEERPTLQPGESMQLEVSYEPTSSFRSAAIEVRSDDDRSEGRKLIEVWGRSSAW